jgi:hypothetical protein
VAWTVRVAFETRLAPLTDRESRREWTLPTIGGRLLTVRVELLSMFEFSENALLEEGGMPPHFSPHDYDPEQVLSWLGYVQTDPYLCRDGVDWVIVLDESDSDGERYRVYYGGFVGGSYLVTRQGLLELGDQLASPDDHVPYWSHEGGDEAHLWWMPESYDSTRQVQCRECGREFHFSAAVTHVDDRKLDSVRCEVCFSTEQTR